jgi:hypothetical protein
MASYWGMSRLLLSDQKDYEDKKLKKWYTKTMELNKIVDEIKDMLQDSLSKSIDPKPEELTDEEISKGYESDNEEEDNWDNLEKACWSGYKQDGMKDKNGKRVPNCVPVKKSLFGTEGPQTLIPRNN